MNSEEFPEKKEIGEESSSVRKGLRIFAAVTVTLLIAAGIWFVLHNFAALKGIFISDDPAKAMDEFLNGNRLLGVFVLFFLQVIQIILAFIPGGPMQMIAGALYGGFFGGLILLAGAAAASALIWWLVGLFGTAAMEAFHNKEKIGHLHRIRALHDERQAEALIWILFLIPGVPKDLLTYFAPLTPVKEKRFLVISTSARCPGIFLTTFASSSLLSGSVWISVSLYALMFVAALGGGWYYQKKTQGGKTPPEKNSSLK